MKWPTLSRRRLLSASVAFVLAACGGKDDDVTGAPTNASGSAPQTGTATTETAGAAQTTQPSDVGHGEPTTAVNPTPTPEQPTRLTPEQLQELKPNELGQIPVMMYHHIDSPPEQFVRTPDQFRGDLQRLYDHGFYVVSLGDILADTLNVPAGKRAVALTFDDSPSTQFNLLPVDGALAIDPDCAIGILEDFFGKHPDFGRGGHFAVLPEMLFDWTLTEAHEDQTPYAQDKLRWLIANGYEVGNHTYDHSDLSSLDNDGIMYELAKASDAIGAIIPNNRMDIVTLPYGGYPNGGDDTVLRGFDFEGRHYVYSAALLVGANPTVAPLSTEFDPYAIARIQCFDEELSKWFETFEENPGILYVSDGNPDTVTVPTDLHPWLVGTLDESKVGNRELVRY